MRSERRRQTAREMWAQHRQPPPRGGSADPHAPRPEIARPRRCRGRPCRTCAAATRLAVTGRLCGCRGFSWSDLSRGLAHVRPMSHLFSNSSFRCGGARAAAKRRASGAHAGPSSVSGAPTAPERRSSDATAVPTIEAPGSERRAGCWPLQLAAGHRPVGLWQPPCMATTAKFEVLGRDP